MLLIAFSLFSLNIFVLGFFYRRIDLCIRVNFRLLLFVFRCKEYAVYRFFFLLLLLVHYLGLSRLLLLIINLLIVIALF